VIERAVERTYAHLAPPTAHIQTIRSKLDHALAGMRTQAEPEAARQQRRLAKLTDERTKLLHAYYQNAIPLDLLHQEQERISTQTANAEAQLQTAHRSATDVQATLQKALDLLAASPDAYANAPGHLRRQWNQALFLRLLVHDQDIQHAEIAEPFATLTTPSLPDELDHPEHEPRHTPAQDPQDAAVASNGHGSNKDQTVGAPGFEPGTSPTRTARATRLRHAPTPRQYPTPSPGRLFAATDCHHYGRPSCPACSVQADRGMAGIAEVALPFCARAAGEQIVAHHAP